MRAAAAQDRPEIHHRVVVVRLQFERPAQGGLGLRVPPLLRQGDAEVHVRLGISRVERDRGPILPLCLPHEPASEDRVAIVVVRDPSAVPGREDPAPERLRIPPVSRLPPGQRAEREQPGARQHECGPSPAREERDERGRGERCERGRGMVGVAVGRDLGPVLSDAQHREERDDVREPRDRDARPPPPHRDRTDRDAEHPHEAPDEPPLEGHDHEWHDVERREPRRYHGLGRIERETVGRDGDLAERRQLVDGPEGPDRDDCAREGQQAEGYEPQVHAPRRRAEPAVGARDPAQRIGLEQEQDRREREHRRLREESGGEGREGEQVPPSRMPCGDRARHVAPRSRDREESGEDVAAFRDPRDRLDAQGVDREEERAHPGGERDIVRPLLRRRPEGEAQQAGDERGEEHRARSMDQEVREVVPARIHSPQRVIEPERHPRQGHPVPEVERGPHPPELREPEPTVVGIQYEVRLVIPGDESGIERRPERRDRDDRDGKSDEWERGAPVGWLAARSVAQGTPGSRDQITIVPQGRSTCPEVNCAGVVASLA
jgi:hypothetical protein